MNDKPEVSASGRVLFSVNGNATVIAVPDGNILVPNGVELTEASRLFWQSAAKHGEASFAARRKAVQDVAHDMRQFSGKVGGTFGAQLESWAEALHNAVEEKV